MGCAVQGLVLHKLGPPSSTLQIATSPHLLNTHTAHSVLCRA